MRYVEREMLEAYLGLKSRVVGKNTRVEWNDAGTICRIYLHGNMIFKADHHTGEAVLLDAGWCTPTTKSRLNALTHHFGLPTIFQEDWEWYIGEQEWEGSYTFDI